MTHNSEVLLKPIFYCRDPFRQGENVLVLCETYVWTDSTFTAKKPANTNYRVFATAILDACKKEDPWFGIEQEYSIIDHKNKFTINPLGWPVDGYPGRQGPYYCSVGPDHCFGRVIMDAHYRACLFANLRIAGTNAETMPG